MTTGEKIVAGLSTLAVLGVIGFIVYKQSKPKGQVASRAPVFAQTSTGQTVQLNTSIQAGQGKGVK